MDSESKIIKELEMRRGLLDNEYSQYEPVHRDIRDYIDPRTARFRGEQVADGKRGDEKILNGSPRFAARTLASGMQSGVTSPLRPWFTLGTPDPYLQDFAPVKAWLYDTQRRMLEVLSRSNMYDRLKAVYRVTGDYGTSVLWVDEDPVDTIRGHDLLTGTYRLYTDDAGRVVGCFREVSMTVYQIVSRFGDTKKVPAHIMSQYDRGEYAHRYCIIHVVEPNKNFKPDSPMQRHKRYVSMWYISGDRKAFLRMSGYDDVPFFALRWDIVGEETYGVGCGELALGDSKQLQLLEKRKLQGVDKNAHPPMIADASLRNSRVSNVPGSTTYVNGLMNGRPGYQPAYQVNPYLNELRSEIAVVQERIDESYYKNLFLLVAEIGAQPNITATQISTMKEEKLLMLGPVLERLNDELLDPLIDRTFNIMLRRGMIAPPPEELQGQRLKVEYTSVMAQAQKAIGISNIERFVGFVGQMAQFEPSALDKINTDEAIDDYAENLAVPPSMVVPTDTANQSRQQRAQQQQQAQMLQQASAGATVAKDLSQTKLDDNNAARMIMEQVGAI